MAATLNTSGIVCSGASTGSITAIVIGGTSPYSYSWNIGGSSPTKNNLAAGNYEVIITDAQNCHTTKSTVIAESPKMVLNESVTDVKCHGENSGSINIQSSGGTAPYSFLWSGGSTSQNRTGLISGNYQLTVTDANSCTIESSYQVIEPSKLSITSSKNNVRCYGENNGNANILVSGGTIPFQYSWSNGKTSEDLYDVGIGTYSLTVTDINLCKAYESITITQPSKLAMLDSTTTNVSCNGRTDGSIHIKMSGGTAPYAYEWTGSTKIGPSIDNLTARKYSVTVNDANNCSTSSEFNISQPLSLKATVISKNIECYGDASGSIETTIAGGTPNYIYQWSNGSNQKDLSGIKADTYNLEIQDSKGCTTTVTSIISQPSPMIQCKVYLPVCANLRGMIDLTVSGGSQPYTHNWSNGYSTEDLYDLVSGTYDVTVNDANGCSMDSSFVISNSDAFHVNASGGGTIKLGESTELSAVATGSNQTTFSWTPTQTLECASCNHSVARPLENTLFTVVAIDTNGCMAQDTVSVIVIDDYNLFAPNVFTPNGDGNNDVFQLFGNLESIHTISVTIFDRWGEKVFESENPHFQWDGIYKGEFLQPGIYPYLLKVVRVNGRSESLQRGSITLLK
ncbi:MAG: gliding motility-associated C-terminal domain-containing protein [Bacteroidetes bacterium]|nr:gliding motility-associated C-terminal domain-containing protein [Bacteroidota bacterium]